MPDESPLPKTQTDFADKIAFRSISSETCQITSVLNRVCYADVIATLDSPPFARAIVEGYLVNTKETKNADESNPAIFNIAGEILPGDQSAIAPAKGEAIQISTGSIIPDGNFSAIRMWEAKKSQNTIAVSRPFPPRFFIEEQGCDIKKEGTLLTAGSLVTPAHIGTFASMGINEILVTKKIQVSIFSSGDEVIPHTKNFTPGSIFDCNLPMLSAAVENAGGSSISCGIQSDDFDLFVNNAKEALKSSDMLLISGGTAVGGRDFISDLVKELGELIIDGVPMRSGRPLIMGISSDGKPIVCVAGYPPEALRGFTLFGQLAMNILSGHSHKLPAD